MGPLLPSCPQLSIALDIQGLPRGPSPWLCRADLISGEVGTCRVLGRQSLEGCAAGLPYSSQQLARVGSLC